MVGDLARPPVAVHQAPHAFGETALGIESPRTDALAGRVPADHLRALAQDAAGVGHLERARDEVAVLGPPADVPGLLAVLVLGPFADHPGQVRQLLVVRVGIQLGLPDAVDLPLPAAFDVDRHERRGLHRAGLRREPRQALCHRHVRRHRLHHQRDRLGLHVGVAGERALHRPLDPLAPLHDQAGGLVGELAVLGPQVGHRVSVSAVERPDVRVGNLLDPGRQPGVGPRLPTTRQHHGRQRPQHPELNATAQSVHVVHSLYA